jgi:two-component system CheB/CheR fusion protein
LNDQERGGASSMTKLNLAAVVGVGAAAPDFQSLVALLTTLPRTTGAAFVVVFESRDAIDTLALLKALDTNGGPPAMIAADGETLEADHVYVAPIGMTTSFDDGRLRVRIPEQQAGHRGTIDSFLISLAEQRAEAAVGIVLAGVTDAGSLGIAHLKTCGGLALAEEPQEPEPASHAPGGAAGMADMRLPLAEFPQQLATLIAHLREVDERLGAAAFLRDGESRLPMIATILRNRTGHDFHGYKANTFLRRIQRRMHVLRIGDLDTYVARLRSEPEETQNLFQDLLIGVTHFFRDPAEFDVLQQRVIPEMLKNKSSGDMLRVWVLGCATGEEAYSLAILLREAIGPLDSPPHVQIFATDIDARALSVARTGRYRQAIEKDVTPERLARWFVKEGSTYAIHKDLREMCIFSAHNVIKDAPFSRVDLVSCRNLLIYLNGDLQDRVIPLFHFSLRPGGHLFLGPSENVTRHARLFQPVDRKHRIFRRQETATRVLPEFPLSARSEALRALGEASVPQRLAPSGSLGKRAERVVERYAPAYVITDEDLMVLNFSGRTGPYLDPSTGVANLNLMNLVHRDLRLDLRAALHRVATERKPMRVLPLRMGLDGEARRVGLTVEPLADNPQDPVHFVVLFHDYGLDPGSDPDDVARDPAVLRDEHVQRLEAELRVTKERLQATIEELESTNEELKSSNEEYQSINEEMQSANEELETSKEELQSVNEELQTVNGELAHRVGELARTNSDLKNLLESTQIATLFLDADFRVKNFTPSMSEVFHLIDSDIGRPIAHIASRVPYPDMADDLRRVLRTLSTIEREIGVPSGRRYLVRVLPYRSVDNFIAGAVLTFLDITETTRAQAALLAAEQRAHRATLAAHIATWEMDLATGDFRYSEGFDRAFSFPPPPTRAAMLDATHADDRAALAKAFDRAMQAGEMLDVEVRMLVAGGAAWVRLTGARADGHVLGVLQDVDQRRRAEGQRELLMSELQHRVKNILAVVRSIAMRSVESADTLEDFNERFFGRIDALARTQGVLANRGAEGLTLHELIRDELTAITDQTAQVRVDGPPVLLRDKAAEALALAIHELVANAMKYGALSHQAGQLTVRWRAMNTGGADRLIFEWLEQGVQMPAGKPSRSGFGRRLIERGLPYDLDATTSLEFQSTGVRCQLELPLGPFVLMLDGEPG